MTSREASVASGVNASGARLLRGRTESLFSGRSNSSCDAISAGLHRAIGYRPVATSVEFVDPVRRGRASVGLRGDEPGCVADVTRRAPPVDGGSAPDDGLEAVLTT